jgi:hypothetical protein
LLKIASSRGGGGDSKEQEEEGQTSSAIVAYRTLTGMQLINHVEELTDASSGPYPLALIWTELVKRLDATKRATSLVEQLYRIGVMEASSKVEWARVAEEGLERTRLLERVITALRTRPEVQTQLATMYAKEGRDMAVVAADDAKAARSSADSAHFWAVMSNIGRRR